MIGGRPCGSAISSGRPRQILAGRKRYPLVDTNGLVLGVHVHAANLHDRDGAQRLLTDRLKEELPRLAIVWADAA